MIQFFLKRKVLTNLLSIFLILVGIQQFMSVRREAFPEISFDWVNIETIYPGAAPDEVEKLVTNVIEDQVRGVDGIDKVQSYSVEGRSAITVRLNEDLSQREKDKVINDIEQAVGRVKDLPPEAERPIVEELTSDQPLITLSVAGGDPEVRDAFAEDLADTIEEIPGVSKVTQSGDRKREIWVEVNRDKLTRARLTFGEVATRIKQQNIDASAGNVEIGNEDVRVRVVNSKETAEEVGNLILRGNDARNYIRVKDVASVTERFEDNKTRTYTNGLESINLNVRKVKSGDTIDLAEAVRKTQKEYESKAQEKGLSLIISDDVSYFIKRRLKVMTNNIFQGGFLILLALFIFLDWRLALVAAIGVPVSLLTVFTIAVPFGFTINLLSLLGFIIVLGMLDDDSVVVAENIYRHLEMGKSPVQACLDGTKEVIIPVIGAVSVSCCGFLPFALVSGIMGKFLIVIPVVIIIAFVMSVLEAFFMLPSHVVALMPLGKPVDENEDKKWFRYVVSFYERKMAWVLDHRLKFFIFLIGFMIFTGFLASQRLRMVLFPEGLVEQFWVEIEMPKGTAVKETEKTFEQVQKALLELPKEELDALTGLTGFKFNEQENYFRYGTQYAQARIFLTPDEKRKRKTKEIIQSLRPKVESLVGRGEVVFRELQAGPPVGSPIDVRIRGKDRKVIGDIIDQLKLELSQLEGVSDLKDSREGGKNEIHILMNDLEAGFAGVNAARIAQDIYFAIDGGEASKIRRNTEEVKIKVRLQEDQRSEPQELMKLDVLNDVGQPIRLGEISTIERKAGLPFLERYNHRPTSVVTGQVDIKKVTSKQATEFAIKKFNEIKSKYPGYEMITGGEAEETAKSMQSLFKAFSVALFLDYVILAAIFSSYLQPLIIILLTVPIGLLGVAYALMLHGMDASFMALLGVVAMTGVVINNAIVLVSFINQKIEEGMDRSQAVIKAGAMRLRPIFASSITTLLGLFPTAYGWGGTEPFVAPMALALAWGLTLAMPMTLFLIPMAYVLLSDFSNWSSQKLGPLKKIILHRITRIMGGKD
ncbi:MAG: efflux RND transporter permease subunit [Elusimicrobiota bacterium]